MHRAIMAINACGTTQIDMPYDQTSALGHAARMVGTPAHQRQIEPCLIVGAFPYAPAADAWEGS